MTRSDFASSDPEAFRSLLVAMYGSRFLLDGSEGGGFRCVLNAATDDRVTVSNFQFSGRVTASTDGYTDVVVFTDIFEGRYDWRSGDVQGDQSHPLVLPARHDLSVDFSGVESAMVTVDADVVARWLARYGGLPPQPTLLPRAVNGSTSVRRAVRFYGDVMPTEAFESPLVRANLLEVLLSVTAQQLVGEDLAPQRAAVPAALGRAEDFLRAHAAEPISIADAAEAAGLSVRGLQDQFQRGLDLTPTQYLRNVRLDGVRAELVRAHVDGRTVSVADVARRWGFAHMGRFAGYYATAFGETPTKTLRHEQPRLSDEGGRAGAADDTRIVGS